MSDIFEHLLKLHDNDDPRVNPFGYQFNRNYKGPLLGKAGKLFMKRGRMNDNVFYKKDYTAFMVPAVWEQPSIGFKHDGCRAFVTKSEIHAMNHYRYSNNAQNKLKVKWDPLIFMQDYLYNLSSATDSNVELPKLKEGFIPRPHQKVVVEFGNLTNGCFINSDQQRSGKTFSLLIYILSQIWNRCLLVVPAKVIPIWERMIKEICDIPSKVLNSYGEISDNIFNIVSYDTLHTIDNLDVDIAALDECHFAIEATARRSKAIARINAEKRIALSGTPIMNNPNDILNILNWVNEKLAIEMKLFLQELGDLDIYEKSRLLGIELKRRCLLLRETDQISTSNDSTINFIEIDAFVENPKDLQEVGRAKVNWAIEYLNSFQNQILVAFYYRETGQMLKARLGNKGCVIDGNSSKEEVKEAIRAFKEGEIQYLCGSTILAEGYDFSQINQLLILEESHHSMRADQYRERLNKLNKRQNCVIDIAVIKGTQDDRLYEILNNKYNMQYGLRDS